MLKQSHRMNYHRLTSYIICVSLQVEGTGLNQEELFNGSAGSVE